MIRRLNDNHVVRGLTLGFREDVCYDLEENIFIGWIKFRLAKAWALVFEPNIINLMMMSTLEAGVAIS